MSERRDDEHDERENHEIDDDEFDEDGSESEVPADQFGLSDEELACFKEVAALLRALLTRTDVTPHQVRGMAALLLGLDRLPLATRGLDAGVMLAHYFNNESSAYEVRLSEDSLVLMSGGNTYDPQVGSDSFSTLVLEAGLGGVVQESDPFALSGWLESFGEACRALEFGVTVDDDSDEASLPWNEA